MSTINKGEKQYGLIIPKKQQTVAPKAGNIFANDDGSDEEDGTDWVKKALKAESEKNKIKKQTKLSIQRALKEDPTIYQYDEVYDDMEETKNQLKAPKEEKKKPKYIQNLLKVADRRKKEQEHRIERMVQKEREAEGARYADKESFVTSAYRAKLEEFKKMEEEESRMDRLEAIADVTKQQDMSGFYRHLYAQTVESPKETANIDDDQRSEAKGSNESTNLLPLNAGNMHEERNSGDKTDAAVTSKEKVVGTKTKKCRQYRQRAMDEDESETEIEIKHGAECKNKISLPTTIKNADNIGVEEEPRSKKQKQEQEREPSTTADRKVTTSNLSDIKSPQNTTRSDKDNIDAAKSDKLAKVKVTVEKKDKTKIWEKRTVGITFEAALERYYARKAARLSVT